MSISYVFKVGNPPVYRPERRANELHKYSIVLLYITKQTGNKKIVKKKKE